MTLSAHYKSVISSLRNFAKLTHVKSSALRNFAQLKACTHKQSFITLRETNNPKMMKHFLCAIMMIFSLALFAKEKSINIKQDKEHQTDIDRSLGYSPYVTIDDSDVLCVYDEYTDDITVLVCDSNDNPVWSGYPSSSNQQCHEFSITGLDNGRCYTLYLYIDGTTYTGEFTK